MKNLLLITIAITFFACTSCKEECRNNYHFQFPVEIAPPQETYNVGDTIWIDFNYDSSKIFDLNSNSTVDINDLDLDIEFGITKFNDTIDNNGIDYFDTVLQKGNLQRLNLVDVSVYSLKFAKTENLYQSFFGLTPTISGNFSFAFTSTLDLNDNIKVTDSDCIENLDEYQYTINDHAENGYNFYINNIEAPYSETSTEEYQKGGIFSFRVE